MTTTTVVNGVNVEQLVGTINAVKGQPEIAKFTFRSGTEWVGGGQTQSTIQGFYGAGQEDVSRAEPFVVTADEPQVLLGNSAGPNGPELVLAALAACLSVSVTYNAAALGIQIESVTFATEGDVDLHGFLGLSEEIRPGYDRVRLAATIKSNASEEQLQALWAHSLKTNPVLDIIRNPVPVEVTLNS